VSGPTFEKHKAAGGGNVHSMLNPWVDWEGLGAVGPAATPATPPPPPPRPEHATDHSTPQEEAEKAALQRHLASADYQFRRRALFIRAAKGSGRTRAALT